MPISSSSARSRAQVWTRAQKVWGKIDRDEAYDELLVKGDERTTFEFGRGELEKALEEAAYALQPGQSTAVVETPRGFHVMKLVERIDVGVLDFDKLEPSLQERYPDLRRAELVQELVARLRSKAKVELFL